MVIQYLTISLHLCAGLEAYSEFLKANENQQQLFEPYNQMVPFKEFKKKNCTQADTVYKQLLTTESANRVSLAFTYFVTNE